MLTAQESKRASVTGSRKKSKSTSPITNNAKNSDNSASSVVDSGNTSVANTSHSAAVNNVEKMTLPLNLSNASSFEDLGLQDYISKYLGELERDVKTFNAVAGLPAEVVDCLNQAYEMSVFSPAHFLHAPLVPLIIEFFSRIPGGLILNYTIQAIIEEMKSAGPTDSLDRRIRSELQLMAYENQCATRLLVTWLNLVINGSMGALDLEGLEERFEGGITRMFFEPDEAGQEHNFFAKMIVKRIITQHEKYFDLKGLGSSTFNFNK